LRTKTGGIRSHINSGMLPEKLGAPQVASEDSLQLLVVQTSVD